MKLGTYNYNTHEAEDTHGVVLGTFATRQEARAAMYAARLSATFWAVRQLPPIPLLQDLNDWVIAQNEKRLPKWKFRFAPDLAAQIQPKLTRACAILFECSALMTDDLSVKLFTEPKSLRGRSYWRVNFRMFRSSQDPVWIFKPTSAERGLGCPASGLVELCSRIVDALQPERFAHLRRDLMLSPYCLCCGKGLTDPVSMARWIGPECWGSASTNLPRIFRAEFPGAA